MTVVERGGKDCSEKQMLNETYPHSRDQASEDA